MTDQRESIGVEYLNDRLESLNPCPTQVESKSCVPLNIGLNSLSIDLTQVYVRP